MKNNLIRLFLVAAVAALGLAALPTTAEAGDSHRFSHKCNACHAPIHKRLVFAGYDSCHRPIYRWTLVTHRCAPPRHEGHRDHVRGHHRFGAEVIVGGVLNFLAERHRAHKRKLSGHGHGH